MTFSLRVECDNAAFEGRPTWELRRILKRVLSDLEAGELGRKVFDVDGNCVGAWSLGDE